MNFSHAITLTLLSVLGIPAAAADLSHLRPFLKEHCYSCHGPDKQKNDIRLDTLGDDLADIDTLRTWQDVLDQINLGEMPPEDAEPQPTDYFAGWFSEKLNVALQQAYALHKTGRNTTVRRLNRLELRNTLRDLLHLDGPVFRNLGVDKLSDTSGNGSVSRHSTDPVRDFPADEQEAGVDTIGDRLVMSPFLLELAVAAAEESIALATHTNPTPDLSPKTYAAHIRTSGPNPGLESWSREINPDYDAIFQRYREPGASTGAAGRVAPDETARNGVGTSGNYRITVEVSSHNQNHPWGELVKSRQDEPARLGLHLADSRRGGLHESNPTSHKITGWALPGDGSRQTVHFETWIDATWTPWLGWENAPYDRSLQPSQLVEKYLPEAFHPKPANDAPNAEKQAYQPAMGKALLTAGYRGPHLRIHRLTIEPLDPSWPPLSHRALYGDTTIEQANPEKLLLDFATRAFRRPVGKPDIDRYLKLVENQLAAGHSKLEAMQAAYTAVIASPRFLYLDGGHGSPPDAYTIASRLSYFLWSSMPDDELFAAAAAGKLDDPAGIHLQVERMLDHPNSASFVRRFTAAWLRLDKLGAMPPERGGPFRIYWDRQLEPQMRKQTDAFFRHMLDTNGHLLEFVGADYTFLNERIASIIYKRDDVWGDGFRKVKVLDPNRGGIMTMPAVMTATANGVDTSPVVRGAWFLENILGSPPPPPPPDVEPLAPDLRGDLDLKQRLARHREDAACNNCHRKIDPYGFVFENFDAMGVWRDRYEDTKKQVEPVAMLHNGPVVSGIADFKEFNLGAQSRIAHSLTEKLLTYATGRTLSPADRPEIDRITTDLHKNNYHLRDLVHLVATSDLFLKN